jgi:hypothetical protein
MPIKVGSAVGVGNSAARLTLGWSGLCREILIVRTGA